ncbi:radical SAM protein [Promethearchaeum syntrophicum]|uniref:Radical SAM protein n=1 Tax=Promethearchaeum syntrophicum TaxID=2594042 RepID=A0A5B9DBX7_9ARCH|nr:radical SAM protein [Candidatus Prometheoarchaeum syntrophicum]QEE16654.1 Radical SAM superfamily protein [Candidatus Prometheoarchaeum syntrophicum]
MTNLQQLNNILRIKVELLCNGIIIKEETLNRLEKAGHSFNFGRKGGAGPAGGRYFRFLNGSIANTQIYIDSHPKSSLIIEDIDGNNNVKLNVKKGSNILPVPLQLISVPNFYSLKSMEKIPYQKIALMHGDRTLATTINQKCRYWRADQQCKFCALEFSLNNGATIERKNGAQIVETIQAARKEDKEFAEHLTLTIGTTETPDKGMADYLEVIKDIRKSYPHIPIHIQIEPMNDISWYSKLHAVGANTIGIHLEILDPEKREEICPGKNFIPYEKYVEHWKESIEVFGKNQVSSFILTGFDRFEDKFDFRKKLEEMVKIGVMPLITPARYLTGVEYKIPETSSQKFYDLVIYAAKLCDKYGLNPEKNQAGCIRCGGCSPIIDAFKFVVAKKIALNKN